MKPAIHRVAESIRHSPAAVALTACAALFAASPAAMAADTPPLPASLAQAGPEASYKAGYEAGYQAALKALEANSAPAPMHIDATAPVVPMAQPVATASGPAAPGARGSQSGEPADWWNHSALLYSKLTPEWRHHAELQFSETSLRGNDSGSAMRASGKLFSRSNRWTNDMLLTIDRRAIAQSAGTSSKRDYRMFQDSVRYDLSDRLYASAGYIWETDDTSYIDNRHTLLAGAGYYLIDTAKVRLNAFAGFGRLKETYLEPVPSLIGITERGSNLLYFYQTFEWKFAENWSLQQGFRQIRDLQESGKYVLSSDGSTYVAGSMVKRYRNTANLSIDYRFSPRGTISAGVEVKHDSNPWPDVLPTDTTKRLSVNWMF